MPDQTRKAWIPLRRSELGTLVLVSQNQDIPRLLEMTAQFAREAFNIDDEALTKFYFSNVPYRFVAEGSERLAAYFYAWIPDRIRDFFKGKCERDDCTASRICKRPGCVCTKSILSSTWTCR
jgi:hypothetical protein